MAESAGSGFWTELCLSACTGALGSSVPEHPKGVDRVIDTDIDTAMDMDMDEPLTF